MFSTPVIATRHLTLFNSFKFRFNVTYILIARRHWAVRARRVGRVFPSLEG